MTLRDEVGELLPLLDTAFPADLVTVLGEFLERVSGARDVVLLLSDYDLQELRPLSAASGSGIQPGSPISIGDSEPGAAYQSQVIVTIPQGSEIQVHVPVTLREERLGVLSAILPDPVDAAELGGLAALGTLLAYVVLAAGRYTDLFEIARRRKPLSLEAEVQWGLQPVRAFGGTQLSLAGQLVPAYDVGGDSYDWVVNHEVATVSAVDAMGHGLNASMLGALAVTALRNGRRAGLSVAERVAFADRAVQRQFGGSQFVTSLALDIHLPDARAMAVNAGHPSPWRIRDGEVGQVELDAQLPIGLFEATTYVAQPFELEPGDRLVLISDGVLEATPAEGEEFGEARLEAALLATAGDPPHEAVRRVVRALLDYQHGELRDDATVLILDWHGGGVDVAANPSVRPEAHS